MVNWLHVLHFFFKNQGTARWEQGAMHPRRGRLPQLGNLSNIRLEAYVSTIKFVVSEGDQSPLVYMFMLSIGQFLWKPQIFGALRAL